MHALLFRRALRDLVARVDVTDHPHARIVRQHALEPPRGVVGSVRHDHEPGRTAFDRDEDRRRAAAPLVLRDGLETGGVQQMPGLIEAGYNNACSRGR